VRWECLARGARRRDELIVVFLAYWIVPLTGSDRAQVRARAR